MQCSVMRKTICEEYTLIVLAHLNLPLSDKHGGRKMEGAEDSELPQKKARKEQKNAPEGVENDAAIASDGAVVSEVCLLFYSCRAQF